MTKTKLRYQQCTRCIMDTSAAEIVFDAAGVCNFCSDFLVRSDGLLNENPDQKEARLEKLVADVRAAGRNSSYDCIVGVSGGVDSSWTLVQVKKLGLRPLAVHMDNGWNSELAQNNISNLVGSLGVDLYTHVIDWHEYKALMQAFFDANVIDVELLYDNAMRAVNYRQAAKYGVKYILSGTNQVTEGIRMPSDWNWFKFDKRNIKAIARDAGIQRFETFPSMGTVDFVWYHFVRRVNWVSFLDYVSYNKSSAINKLEAEYGFKRYPYKHYESIFTRFYQGYLLPEKFAVDKRIIHLSNLIVTGQMSKTDALNDMNGRAYSSEYELQSDLVYFLKKMGWSKEKLSYYIAQPRVPHDAFPSEKPLWDFLNRLYKRRSRV